MALKIRFHYPTGAQLGYSIERLCDGLFYDFSTSAFVASPATMTSKLPEDQGLFAGRYKLTLTPTPVNVFTNGDYAITVHDQANAGAVVAQLASTMLRGDDASEVISGPTNPTVLNNGFETPVIGPGKFQYGPTGGTWSFSSTTSGITGNASAFNATNPAAPEGAQVAFIQYNGSISQTITNWAAGNYAILFKAVQRGDTNTAKQSLNVLVDGLVVGTCTPVGTVYGGYYKTNPFTVTQGNHSISFVGINPSGGDNTAFIDDIQIVSV